MCGLFGFSSYGSSGIKNLNVLTNSLAEHSAERGTDATGIAFCNGKKISILKEPKSAYKIKFKHSDKISALVGHTRHATQGKVNLNYNNHPFSGRVRNATFALAHNGVLMNDNELRKSLRLPKTKIETDSYIAVQLIESQKTLNAESLKYMAENVNGSFSFSILDNMNNIYKILIRDSSKKIVDDFDFRMWKNNNSKKVITNKCPYCESNKIIKYGMYRSNQRYKCKEESCGRIFTNKIYDQFRYSKKFKDKWREYFKLLNKGLTIRECAAELNITIVTAFFWRHRFLYDIKSNTILHYN